MMNRPKNRIVNKRVALMVARKQLETLGHGGLQSHMRLTHDVNVLGLGSCEKSGVFGNPLTAEQRIEAHEGLWKDAFDIVRLEDIGATDEPGEWVAYVLASIARAGLPTPTDFYAGCAHEARWYAAAFAAPEGEPHGRNGNFVFWENPETGNRLHLLDRTKNLVVSSSQVRALLEARDPSWKEFVSAKLWDYYEWVYPGHLRAPVAWNPEENEGQAFPEACLHPTGTLCTRPTEPGVIWVLRADGKWRARDERESVSKSLGD